MEAIVLCGGLGTRLRNALGDRPKALADVRGRPFLEWLLLGLAHRAQVQHVILATGYGGEIVERHFGHGLWCGINLTYSRESSPLGTAGALHLAFRLTDSQHLLVMNGDTYCHYDSQRLVESHLLNNAAATLWLSAVNDTTRFGSVDVDPEGRILGFSEKIADAGPHLANAGVYLLRRDVIAAIPGDRPVSLELEIFPSLVGRGLYGVEGTGAFVDIGTPESLEAASDTLAGELSDLNCE